MANFIGAHSQLLHTMGTNSILAIATYIAFRAGVYSFAGGGLLAIGAYVGLYLTQHAQFNLVEASLLLLVGGLVLGLVLGTALLKLRLLYLSIASLTFSLIIQAGAYLQPLNGLTGGSLGVAGITQVTTGWDLLWLVVILSAGCVVFEKIRLGKVARAVSINEVASELVGINTHSVRLWSFAISSALFLGFGPIWAHAQYIIDPSEFSFSFSVQLLLFAAIGGAYSVWGAVVAAGAITAAPSIFTSLNTYEPMLYAGVLLVIVLFLPGGISSAPSVIMSKFRGVSRIKNAPSLPEILGMMLTSSVRGDGQGQSASHDSGTSTEGSRVSVSGATVEFRRVVALRSVDLEIRRGEVLAIIGPNGAGKTTLLNALSGIVRLTGGQMRLDGVDVTRQSIHARARSGIARTLQTPHVFNELSVGDNLGLAKGAPSLRERLAGQPDFEVSNAAWSRIFRRHGIVATLPYGAKRLIEIARVQGLNPSVLLLDEPSAGLTAAETSRLADIIRLRADSGCAVVVVEHNLRLVRAVADKVIVLVAGQKISEGSIDDVQANSDVQAAYLGGVVIPTQSGDQA